MKKQIISLVLSIILIAMPLDIVGQILNSQNQPAASGDEFTSWQPNPSLIPLLDRFYADASQTDYTYQLNANFFCSLYQSVSSHAWKSEEEKLEAQRLYKYIAIYLHYAFDLLQKRKDLVQRYLSVWKEATGQEFTEDDFWQYCSTDDESVFTPEAKLLNFFLTDIIVEQEIEKYVESSLKSLYQE